MQAGRLAAKPNAGRADRSKRGRLPQTRQASIRVHPRDPCGEVSDLDRDLRHGAFFAALVRVDDGSRPLVPESELCRDLFGDYPAVAGRGGAHREAEVDPWVSASSGRVWGRRSSGSRPRRGRVDYAGRLTAPPSDADVRDVSRIRSVLTCPTASLVRIPLRQQQAPPDLPGRVRSHVLSGDREDGVGCEVRRAAIP